MADGADRVSQTIVTNAVIANIGNGYPKLYVYIYNLNVVDREHRTQYTSLQRN